MNKNDKMEFAIDYIRFLISTQARVDELYASICYGGVVFDDTRINLDEVFATENLLSQDISKVAKECSSNIGNIMDYLEERSEAEYTRFLKDDEELVAYIQMPVDIWDALYWGSEGETAEYLAGEFEEFLENKGMYYELTEYGRNAVLIYKIKSMNVEDGGKE